MADDLFECSQFVDQRYPDNIGQWPEMNRLTAYAARDRLLKDRPGSVVAAEESYCIDSSNTRWPNPVPENLQRFTHALLYKVQLRPADPPILVPEGYDMRPGAINRV